MALIVETGAGVTGADAYASNAVVSAYWTDRPHMALSVTWLAQTAPDQDGAIREATAYIDAVYGPFFLGSRLTTTQGLLFPRGEDAIDRHETVLPAMPNELVVATCELAARAISAPLAEDADRGGMVVRKREKLGPLEEETEYSAAATVERRFGNIDGLLASIMDGLQPNAPVPAWNWL